MSETIDTRGTVGKRFKVASRSSNHNSFGLYGHILVAKDGETWQVGRSRGPWNEEWTPGTEVFIPFYVRTDGMLSSDLAWSQCSVEIPRKLAKAPEHIVNEIWA